MRECRIVPNFPQLIVPQIFAEESTIFLLELFLVEFIIWTDSQAQNFGRFKLVARSSRAPTRL